MSCRCVKIMPDILDKASKIYEKQKVTGRVQMFACDFQKLEQVAVEWENNN